MHVEVIECLEKDQEAHPLLGGDELHVPRLPRYGTESMVVYVLNENLLFGLFVFPKAFQQLDFQDKLIEWWWRFVATVYALCVVVLFLAFPMVLEVKPVASLFLWELISSICAVVALNLFRVFRDHYLLLSFNTQGCLGGLKIITLDIGLPLSIVGSFAMCLHVFGSSEHTVNQMKNNILLQWLLTWVLTFTFQILWCMFNFLSRFSVCSPSLHLRQSLQQFRLSVSALSVPEDSPVFLLDDRTPRESVPRKVERSFCALCYVIAGFALVIIASMLVSWVQT